MRNTIKNAIIIGVKTSNQLVVPMQIFMIKSTALKSTAKEMKISLKPIFFAAAFLVLLLANGINYLKAISILLFFFLPAFVALVAIGFSIPFPTAAILFSATCFEINNSLNESALACDII